MSSIVKEAGTLINGLSAACQCPLWSWTWLQGIEVKLSAYMWVKGQWGQSVKLSTWALETLQMREDDTVCNKVWAGNELSDENVYVTQIFTLPWISIGLIFELDHQVLLCAPAYRNTNIWWFKEITSGSGTKEVGNMCGLNKDRLVYWVHAIMLCIPARDELMFGFELLGNQYTEENGTKCIIYSVDTI